MNCYGTSGKEKLLPCELMVESICERCSRDIFGLVRRQRKDGKAREGSQRCINKMLSVNI